MKRPVTLSAWYALVAASLLMTACGGSGSSAPVVKNDHGPSLPVVSVSGGYAGLPPSTAGGIGPGLLNVSVQFKVTLSAPANGIATVDYTTVGGTATGNLNFLKIKNTLAFQPGETSMVVNVPIIGGGGRHPYTKRTNKNFFLELENPSANIALGTARAQGVIMYATQANDTGITTCATTAAKGLPCGDAFTGTDAYPGQDAEFGRDAIAKAGMLSKAAAGDAAFDFTKMDINGRPLPNQTLPYSAEAWYCVRDNVTGLVWEVKTPDSMPGFVPHRTGNSFTWYSRGKTPTGTTTGTPGASGTCGDFTCDTDAYVSAVNQAGYCGSTHWRMPTAKELQSLVDYGRDGGPAIDPAYFPNTQTGSYWTSSRSALADGRAWIVDFGTGAVAKLDTATPAFVRLVKVR